MKKAIGAQLATLRKQAGYTQVRLGELLGFSDQYISRVEKDRCAPSWRYLAALAQVLQIPVGELLERTGYAGADWAGSAEGTLAGTDQPLAQLIVLARADEALTLELLRYAHDRQKGGAESYRGATGAAPQGAVDKEAVLALVRMVAAHPDLLELLLLWRKVPEDATLLVQWGQRLLAASTASCAQG